MDSDPLPMLEKSDALQRHEVHGNTQETGFDFRHLPSGAKRIKSMDGKAQKTTITQSLRDCSERNAPLLTLSRRESVRGETFACPTDSSGTGCDNPMKRRL